MFRFWTVSWHWSCICFLQFASSKTSSQLWELRQFPYVHYVPDTCSFYGLVIALLNDSLAFLCSVSKLFSAWMLFYECSPLFLVLTVMMQMRCVALHFVWFYDLLVPCHLHTFFWKLRRGNHRTLNLYKIQDKVLKHILKLYMQNIWLYATILE